MGESRQALWTGLWGQTKRKSLVLDDKFAVVLGLRMVPRMRRAQIAMRHVNGVDFGFLGCRDGVVPIYESAGWVQVHAIERCLSRAAQTSIIESRGTPILICSANRDASEWPKGDIDLRSTTW